MVIDYLSLHVGEIIHHWRLYRKLMETAVRDMVKTSIGCVSPAVPPGTSLFGSLRSYLNPFRPSSCYTKIGGHVRRTGGPPSLIYSFAIDVCISSVKNAAALMRWDSVIDFLL